MGNKMAPTSVLGGELPLVSPKGSASVKCTYQADTHGMEYGNNKYIDVQDKKETDCVGSTLAQLTSYNFTQ